MIDFPPNMIRGISNCGVVAMAVAANVDYMVAHEWFKARARRRNWTGVTRHADYGTFLREHGVWFEQVDYDRQRRRLIGDFVKWGAKPDRLYVIRSAGHAMYCMNGIIGDQHAIQHIDDGKFWKRNSFIKSHWEIFR